MPNATEAREHVAGFNRRKRQAIPAQLVKERPSLYIHNIHNMQHRAELGGLRTWIIPPCPEGQEYSTLKIPGLIPEDYDMGDGNGNMAMAFTMGEDLAKEIVGTDTAMKDLQLYTTNKEWFGVFSSRNEVPTKKELEKSREKLDAMMTLLVADGNRRAMEGNSDKPGVGVNSIGPMHRKAVLYTGQKVSWMTPSEKYIECPGCGEKVKPTILKHPACGWIFDKAKWEANQKANA